MNAKEEFLKHIEDREVLCVDIYLYAWEYEKSPEYRFLLKKNYSPKDYKDFLEKLNFYYDNGWGGQELFGTIWYKEGTYSDRGEYDGSEWWVYRKVPEIPEELR